MQQQIFEIMMVSSSECRYTIHAYTNEVIFDAHTKGSVTLKPIHVHIINLNADAIKDGTGATLQD